VLGEHPVFLEPDAVLLASVLDAREGPLYFGAGSEVMPGCLIRGPFALGDHAVLKMGAKLYGGTTIGPGCRAGGEISQSLLFANSNKGHDGFLGHSVLGEWCNLGADTNTSNLKNDYGPVKLYNAASGQLENTGRQFCGLFMGDHSKSGINTMFNTGTVVGVCANIFGGGFPPKFIPSFAWGGAAGWSSYRPEKALETARRVMARRKLSLLPEQEATLLRVFETTLADRAWESP
jgi:UDP-N-acetylglucosamine diphosphorylase/glucosamine-1-phosphate N-acetyltransferase